MELHQVAKVSQITDKSPFIVSVKGITIGIYKLKGNYYAYENECAHEGGPVVEGKVTQDLICEVSDKGKCAEYFSDFKYDIVCPWHGVQYDLETGICRADKRLKLNSFEVFVDGDYLKVRV